jgi:hypothetical protein
VSEHPLNDLEAALFDAMAGKAPMDGFLSKLATSQICVPSSTEVQSDGRGMNPITYDRNGTKMVAAFTHMDRIELLHKNLASYCLRIDAAWFIENMPRDMGMILFAGPGRGCELLPAALDNFRGRL